MIFDSKNIKKGYYYTISYSNYTKAKRKYLGLNIKYRKFDIDLIYENNILARRAITYSEEHKNIINSLEDIVDNLLSVEKFSDFCNALFKYIDFYFSNLIFT